MILDETNEHRVYRHVAKALGKIGFAAIPTLVHLLQNDVTADARAAAVYPLSGIGDVATPSLIEALRRDSDATVRRTIAAMFIEARSLRPEVVDMLKSEPDAKWRAESRHTVEADELRDSPPDVVPVLIDVLVNDDNDEVRKEAATH